MRSERYLCLWPNDSANVPSVENSASSVPGRRPAEAVLVVEEGLADGRACRNEGCGLPNPLLPEVGIPQVLGGDVQRLGCCQWLVAQYAVLGREPRAHDAERRCAVERTRVEMRKIETLCQPS